MKVHLCGWQPPGGGAVQRPEEIILALSNETEAELYQLESLLDSFELFGAKHEIDRDKMHGKIMVNLRLSRE